MKLCSEAADEILGRISAMKNNERTRSKLDMVRVIWLYDWEAAEKPPSYWREQEEMCQKRCINALFSMFEESAGLH